MIEAERFRAALSALPAPVTLVTSAAADGTPAGATVSAFSSLSLDPPLVLVSLDYASLTLSAIRARRAFAVHVLGGDHQSLAVRFAGKREERFVDLEFATNARGVPLLSDYAIRFECLLFDEFPGGDHAILVGAVEDVVEHEMLGDPAIWYRRAFQRFPS